MNKIFTDETWTKNWSGNWGLPFASLYGDIYTKGIKELVGKSFAHNLIVFESGTSSNYLVQKELKNHCNYLATLIQNDEALPKKWSDQVITNTDKIFAFIKILDTQQSFSPQDYYELQRARLVITVANFSIKKVIDYLPSNLMEKYLHLFTTTRLHSEPVYSETERLLSKIIHSITGGKISAKNISVLLKEELNEYFSTGKLPDQQELDSRFEGCAVLYDENGDFQLYRGTEFKEIMTAIVAGLAGSTIKGMVAFKGKVRGQVRIVLDPRKCTDFRDGDILVAGMTRPEYLSLMKKSGAFITDAGGLLSHAAIVARELKKPCIVGTEIATKVLKDGDIVEVDAEVGIVRKI